LKLRRQFLRFTQTLHPIAVFVSVSSDQWQGRHALLVAVRNLQQRKILQRLGMSGMPDTSTSYLRLHVHDDTTATKCAIDQSEMDRIGSAFEKATGWTVTGRPQGARASAPNAAQPIFRFTIDDMSERLPPNSKPSHREKSSELLEVISDIYADLQKARQKIVELEAEAATAVHVVQKPDDEGRVARLFTSLLSAMTETLGCQRAAIYLLDDATERLHMRCNVGLPGERLTAPPRDLKTAVADVQALSGNAIVIEDASLLNHWNIPEAYPAAACVPISSMSTPMGTLWVFADEARDFNDNETSLMEIFAGRIASELDRLSALKTARLATQSDTKSDSKTRLEGQLVSDQQQRQPSIKPLVEGWEIDGWSGASVGVIHDWAIVPDARLAMLVASVQGSEIERAIVSAMIQSSFHSLRDHCVNSKQFAATINETLWTMLPGCPNIGIMFTLIDPNSGIADYFVCGDCRAVIADSDRLISLERTDFQIGKDPTPELVSMSIKLMPGQSLVAAGGQIARVLSPVHGVGGQQIINNRLPMLSGCDQWLEWVQQHVADSFETPRVAHSTLAVIHREKGKGQKLHIADH
jgi:phosphoserine phosphatase RsbU/P